MNDLFEAGYEAGKRETLRNLSPLGEAITDAAFMFKDIEKARQLPAFADVQQQYVAMGKQLERLFALSGIQVKETD